MAKREVVVCDQCGNVIKGDKSAYRHAEQTVLGVVLVSNEVFCKASCQRKHSVAAAKGDAEVVGLSYGQVKDLPAPTPGKAAKE